jgi:transposase
LSDPSNPSDPSDPSTGEGTGGGIPFDQFIHFGGLDWARSEHQLVVVDRGGQIVLSLRFADDVEGWALFRQKSGVFPKLAVAIETSCGPAVERLMDAGLSVFPMNPKAATRYRDRKAPAGAKDDALDAWSFADALRSDGHGWRPLLPQDPLTAELRLLCRDEVKLIGQRTALVNQLRAALCEYYPAALAAFDDWTGGSGEGPWRLVITFPTPEQLVKAGQRKWEKFLHAHKLYRPQTARQRLASFADALKFASPNPAVTRAKTLLAVSLAKQLCLLQSQLDEYRDRIVKLFGDHPDHDCFGSLPGAGAKIAPRLLSELGSNRQVFQSAEALQNYAGTSPVTRQSGRACFVTLRRACNKTLRSTVHLWADLSRKTCVWAEAYYQKKRADGMAHAAAVRCLGHRWMKILWKMWQTGMPYDEALHLKNQTAHGSWVIKLLPSPAAKSPR